jgi:demethylmenaquinone methyltransferase/2-methoxy-6-polyprenyl-1,4-benzoquinol methylase
MPETSGKEKTVYQIFQKIAGRYDRSNILISLGLQGRWKRMLTGRLLKNLPEGAAVLDVCCGTGDIALELARARRNLRVTGLDFSPAMLKEAEKRRRGRKNVRFLQGNAMALPFRDAVFDAAVISFGLRNTADYGRTLREMVRVVKADGSVLCLDSFVPGMRLVRPFYRFYFRNVMPLIGGGLKHRKEYRWLYLSTQSFLRPEQLVRLFREAGLEDVCLESRMFGACALVSGCRAQSRKRPAGGN